MLKTIIFKFILAVWFVAWAPLLLIGLVDKRLNLFFVTLCASGCLFLPRMICGIKYEIHHPCARDENGIPTIPNGNLRADGRAIIAAKHMSILEIAILQRYIKNSFFIIKRELLWIPIYGWAFARMGLVGVNRARGATNMQRLVNICADKIRNGGRLVIFPEGTRVRPGIRPKLKRGLLFIAESLKLPIQPVGTDTGLYWPKRGEMKGGTANVWFEPLLPPTATLDQVHDVINRHSA